MKDFIARLGSRKFLLALAAFATFQANKQHTEAVGVVVAYLLAEAGLDAKALGRATADAAEQAEQDDATRFAS